MKTAPFACRTPDQQLARRRFLGIMAATAAGSIVGGGIGMLTAPALASQLQRQHKRVVVIEMHGGSSQLETWDPKPGAETGGPFLSIPTSVPGIHISELLPYTAQVMQHLCLIRGVNTSEDDHGKGTFMMLTGRRQTPAAEYPRLGAVCAKLLATPDNPLPGNILITPGGGGGRGNDSAYLGPRYASIHLGNGNPPPHTALPAAVTESSEQSRQEFRRQVNERFLSRRRTAMSEAYTYSYEQALQLMQKKDTFDVTKEPVADQERYGKHDFGRHCLLARRLLEQGVSYVQLSHANYDTHNENFNFHIEQLGEFDRPFSCFVQDLADRGMLESTLLVVLSEFGRTPNINHFAGRDHWSRAWSVCVAGARFPRGVAYGKTNDKGTEVIEGQCDHGNLFHTYLQALGVDSTGSFQVDGRDLPIADPAVKPISGLLV